MRSRWPALVLALLCLASGVAGVASLAAGADPGGNQTTTHNATGAYTLQELSQTGKRYGNSPDSARIADQRIWWVVHWPASKLTANPGEDDEWEYLEPGRTVERNHVYLRTIRATKTTETKNVTIVYWQKGTTTVQRGNTTVEKPVAKNVTVVEKQLTFGPGWPSKPIELRQHDQPVRVTMWINGMEDTARWQFRHKSVATTGDAGINTEGQYLTRAAFEFLIPIILGGFLMGWIIKRAIERAGIGPQWGYTPWILILSLGMAIVTAQFYTDLASILVHLPYLASAFVVGIFGIIMLETFTTNVSKVLFLRPDVEDAISPSGDDAKDMLQADVEEHRILELGDRGKAVVQKGLFPFLSRCFGGAAILENAEQIKSQVRLPNSTWSEIYYVDPSAPAVLDYNPEGWTWEMPSVEEDGWADVGLILASVAGGLYLLGSLTGPTVATVAAVPVAMWLWLEPTDGYARIEPAPTHMRSAHASMMLLTEEYQDAETIDNARTELWSERAGSSQDVERVIEDHDTTLVQEMLDSDVARSIDGDERDDSDDSATSPEVEADD